jgi:hypothetical protein
MALLHKTLEPPAVAQFIGDFRGGALDDGTTTLFAALSVLDGTVIGRCMQRHRHSEFIRFLNTVEHVVPAGKLIHAVLDNYATHKHPKVLAWLSRHPRGDHPREKGDPQARRGPLGSGSAGAIVLLRAKPGDAVAIRLLFIFASVLARVKTRSEPKVRRLSAGGNGIRTLSPAD